MPPAELVVSGKLCLGILLEQDIKNVSTTAANVRLWSCLRVRGARVCVFVFVFAFVFVYLCLYFCVCVCVCVCVPLQLFF